MSFGMRMLPPSRDASISGGSEGTLLQLIRARMPGDTGRRRFSVALDTLQGTALTVSQVALCLMKGLRRPSGVRKRNFTEVQ